MHLELRFLNTRAVRQAGYERVRDLRAIKPDVLFDKHIKLVDFDAGAFSLQRIRQAVNADRKEYRKKEISPFLDKYRASITRRIGSLVQRGLQGHVQRVKDFYPAHVAQLTAISTSVLRIPTALSWGIEGSEEFRTDYVGCEVNIKRRRGRP